MNNIVKSLMATEFQEVQENQIIENVDAVISFTKSVLQADNLLIWIEDKEKDIFWSFHNSDSIFLGKKVINALSNRGNLITKEKHPKLVAEIHKITNCKEDINNILFYKICDEINHHTFLIEVINIKNEKFLVPNSRQEILNLLSTVLIQTVQIKGVSSLAKYYFDEQNKAYKKQKEIIQNDLTNSKDLLVDVFYKPADILNGDSYSIYKTLNGDIFIYVIDAMGHGIGPSLTSYSISAIIKQRIKTSQTFNDLMETVLDNVQYILTDEEQLTCGFFWFAKDFSKVEYVVAGMYAPMILDNDKLLSAKANNIPFMNFAFDFNISTIELENFQKFLIFTDGLVEDTQDLEVDLNLMISDKNYSDEVFQKLDKIQLEDDTTIIKLTKLK